MKNISRESIFINSFTQFFHLFLTRETCFTFLLVPALFFISCQKIEHEVLHQVSETRAILLKSPKSNNLEIHTTDVFIFENDALERLHCYQRFEESQETYYLGSGSGEKSIFVLMNGTRDKYEWAEIRSLSSLSAIISDLENESREHPIMTYNSVFTAGEEIVIKPTPLMCEILIRSIRCDFSEESYFNEKLRDVRAYLTYVNASCSITSQTPVLPSRIINTGRLEKDILNTFRDSTLISGFIAREIDREGVYPALSLCCYPNNSTKESIGSPFTRLVIEGKLGNDTYYYPIRINPERGGISRGGRYCYDIVITKAGATDPDGRLDDCNITYKMEIEEWKEMGDYDVHF